MGLMDKFKNLFIDEEEVVEEELDTIEIKEVKKEEEINKLPTFMREKIEQEEKKPDLKISTSDTDFTITEDDDTTNGSTGLPNLEERRSFKFPVDLTEDDFVETRSRQSMHQRKKDVVKEEVSVSEAKTSSEPIKVKDIYKDKKTSLAEEKPKFKATPIISPIYGILDKNYTTGDIVKSSINNLEETRHSKTVDFDTVRKKAYGDLTKEIKENLMCENCEYLKEAKECQKEREEREKQKYEELRVKASKEEPTYSYEVLEETEAYQDITLDEATENYYDYGVAYEKQEEPKPVSEVLISNFSEEERPKREIPPVKSNINLLSTLKKSMGDEDKKEESAELTDDLFSLIDSMYDERDEK